MATIIPDLLPEQIANDGERAFYQAALGLPDDYVVFYSRRYYEDPGEEKIREADFVIVHRNIGFVAVEIKEGTDIRHFGGRWHEVKDGGYVPLEKDPVEQARTAMFWLRQQYQELTGEKWPGKYRFAICFPETDRFEGRLPPDLKRESIWTGEELENLSLPLERLLGAGPAPGNPRLVSAASEALIERVLAPRCRIFSSLEDRISSFRKRADISLTEEQQRILEETEEDKRKLFLGAAGTGKTFIAMEKARRCAAQGKKVLLTCFNKNLVNWMRENVTHPSVTINNFHGFLTETLLQAGVLAEGEVREDEAFYEHELPDLAFQHFSVWSDSEKFDAIIVDEGQDFRDHWMTCLETALVPDGELYIFADPNQNLFGGELEKLRQRYDLSKHRLTFNLRNADTINEWLRPFAGGQATRSRLTGGVPVVRKSFRTPEEQKRLLEKEIGRLVSQGLPPQRILILSPFRLENSGLKDVPRLRDWPIVDFASREYGIRYATIRSFKGLEADVVFLIDLRESKACTPADVYVGASRARFILYVLHHESWQGYAWA